MRKIITLCLVVLALTMAAAGCANETNRGGKAARGEGDFGEGEPCISSDDCDEIGEICVAGTCIYEENA